MGGGLRLGVVCAVAYLVGAVPVGLWLTRVLHPGVDLRGIGTGNLGTSNIFRNVDGRLAVLVGPLQFAQGLSCVLGARWMDLDTASQGTVAVAAVAGNCWPLFANFNGGRGIAVATGTVAGLGLWGLGTLLIPFAAGALLGEIAAGVLAGFIMLPAVEFAAEGAAGLATAVILLGFVVLRRMEGVRLDVARGEDPAAVILDRLVRDRRPGRPLVGRRTDL